MKPEEILDRIEEIFPDAKCELVHETPFQLLIAVVLSAQTTDAAVNKVTPALFARYPDAKSMMNADIKEVQAIIRSIGLYPTKSKNIIALSQKLEEEFGGQVPMSFKELQSLPGVGRKTANVVRSVAFDIPSMAVDTHVERVSKRLGLAKPADDVGKVEEKLRRKLPRERWNKAHHELIFFGRYYCTARNPHCGECPFASFCKKERIEAFKEKDRLRRELLKEEKRREDQ